MRKIGAHVSSAGGPTNAIKNALAIEANCFQIFAGSPRTWARSLYAQTEVQKFNELILEHHLDPVFIHALYLVNLGSDNPATLENSIKSLATDLQNGDQINASGVIVHLGSHQGRGFEAVSTQIISTITSLLDQTKTTNFIIENTAGQKGKIGTLEEIESIFKAINSPRLKICLDTAHLFQGGWDLNQSTNTDKLIAELESRHLLAHLICLHLNDSKTTLGSAHDVHANLGEGQVSLPGLEYLVNHPKLNHLPLILEVPALTDGQEAIKNIRLAQSLIHT